MPIVTAKPLTVELELRQFQLSRDAHFSRYFHGVFLRQTAQAKIVRIYSYWIYKPFHAEIANGIDI